MTLGVPNATIKGCILKNFSNEKFVELVLYNLNSLKNILNYNISNDIRLFRISSDIIPFGSNEINKTDWAKIFYNELNEIGNIIRSNKIRVSMHPGQYTVLNSPDSKIVSRAIEDINYHSKFLDSLGIDSSGKIILHIGGVYGDKTSAMIRFSEHYKALDESVKLRLVIENDDKSYNIDDVLDIGTKLNIPVAYDNLHNKLNPYDEKKDDNYWISQCTPLWKKNDGPQKIHYSQQNKLKNNGSHSDSININEFLEFYNKLSGTKPDIMLEVKDKNLSAVKCINCTTNTKIIKNLELEWGKYKYSILEKSPNDYLKIRQLLKDKTAYPVVEFYNIIESALSQKKNFGNSLNAALHVWGYFKETATTQEKLYFNNLLKKAAENSTSFDRIKNFLFKLSLKYKQDYLINSYFFIPAL